MLKKLILNLALSILRKNRGHIVHNDVRIQIMTPTFGEWVYTHGYKFYKNSITEEQKHILKDHRKGWRRNA